METEANQEAVWPGDKAGIHEIRVIDVCDPLLIPFLLDEVAVKLMWFHSCPQL
jgi:hypothetical protein